jgi:hypothetical protein
MKKEVKCFARLAFFSVIGLVMTVNVSRATPSTIIWIPSIDLQGFNQWHLGIDNYIRTQSDNGVRGAGMYDAGITVGILPFKNFQGEVGVDYLSMGDHVFDQHPVYFNGKFGMPEGALFKNAPGIAIGAFNFGLQNNLTNYNIIYGVIAKTLPFVGRLSIGYYQGNEKLLVDNNGAKANTGIIAAWERPLKEISDKLGVAVDFQGGKNYLGAFNFALTWAFTDKISMIAGYDIYNDHKVLYNSTNTNQNTFTTQIDINF